MFFQGLSLLLAIPLMCLPGVPGGFEPTDRIVGGKNIAITEVPWQVSLQYKGQHFCGGSIYSETMIITAAHCVKDKMTLPLEIRAGSSKYNNGGTLVKVEAIRYHEKFSRRLGNDVAVIKLKSPLTFSDTIKPISLAEKDPAVGSVALSTGWGATKRNSGPQDLQGVVIKIERLFWCKFRYPFILPYIHSNDICAGTRGKSASDGDSGGPLVVNRKLVGIASRKGNFLCWSSGFYVSVAKFNKWIQKAIKSF
nr:trypsin delta-like [Drosophila takahashii]